jgi:predicted lipoprotein with Yx(FWY)xxD motif
MKIRLPYFLLLPFAAAACGTAVGSYTSPVRSTPSPAAAAIRIGDVPGIGAVLTDAQGKTLYYFLPERGGRIACTGQCAEVWPPVPPPAGSTSVIPGLSGQIGRLTRPDGSAQLTYATWPLYTFVKDTVPGEATGQGVNQFFAATPALSAPTLAPTPASTASPTPVPTPRPSPSATPCMIPQNGGGDGDADNFGAPSDGDGCDR